MEILIWGGVFVVSLVALVKGADWVLDNSKKIGLALGLSPFIIGVVILGFGTSAPELVSSIFAVLQKATEIPVANAIGSNIANILLVVGLSAVVARGRFEATKSLIDLEIPLLILATSYFFGVAYDGVVTPVEGIFLLAGFVVYILYTLLSGNGESAVAALETEEEKAGKRITLSDIFFLVVGFALLIFGAQYLVESVLVLSQSLGISVGVITLLAVALGTSLPELVVSIKAALSGNAEVSIGNIFGSNIFNLLLVVGVPALITPLAIDTVTLTVALPAMLVATILFVISGLSQRIHSWEGMFYLLLYALFVAKIFGWA
ncbi:MAG: calcium/sodium antiporter [Patescibacteria group bacterium UBA2163]